MFSFAFFPQAYSWEGLGGGVADFHSCLISMAPNIKSYSFIPEATHSFVEQTWGFTASMATAWLMNANC